MSTIDPTAHMSHSERVYWIKDAELTLCLLYQALARLGASGACFACTITAIKRQEAMLDRLLHNHTLH